MNQRLWSSSLGIIFSVFLLLVAVFWAGGVVKAARVTGSGQLGVVRCAELPARNSVELDAFYLKEL
jgi:hypothetical protein